MPKTTPVKFSFAAGEISPLARGRVDTEGYRSGCAEMLNMKPDPRGAARGRPGWRLISVVPDLEQTARLFGVRLDADNFIAIGLMGGASGGTLRVWHNVLGAIHTTTLNDDVHSVAWDESDVRDAQFIMWPTGTNLTLVSPRRHPIKITIAGTPENPIISEQQVVLSGLGTLVGVANETPDGSLNLFSITPATAVTPETLEINVYGTPNRQEKLYDWDDDNDGQFGVFRGLPNTIAGATINYTTGACSAIKFANPPPAGTTVQLWTYSNREPFEWGYENYPGCGVAFQGRLWLAGSPSSPHTIWGSESNNYDNWLMGGDLANEPMQFTVFNETNGGVQWLAGTKQLIVGANDGEFVILHEGTPTLEPGKADVRLQSRYGSNHVRARQVGDELFYISPDSTKVRAMQYQWSEDNWMSRDLTFMSEHITFAQHISGGGIFDVTWAQNPENLFLCALGDGNMAVMTYERGNNLFGWARWASFGDIRAITSVDQSGNSIPLALIQDPDISTGGWLCAMDEAKFMDMHVTLALAGTVDYYDFPAGVGGGNNDIYGFDGRELAILINGAYHPPGAIGAVGPKGASEQPATNLRLWFEKPTGVTSTLTVGFGYTQRLTTLPLELGVQGGTSLSYIKSWNKIYLRLVGSALPLINAQRAADRTPASQMNYPEPFTTGRTHVVERGWNEEGQVSVEQDMPFPLNVTSLFGEASAEIL
jgi:hypothetical protein